MAGTYFTSGFAFTITPTETDARGDNTYQNADILNVWIDNDADFLRIKVEILGFFDATPDEDYNSFNSIAVGITTDNDTGGEVSEFWTPINYILWWVSIWEHPVGLEDVLNSTNSAYALNDEMGYYILTNSNHTLEFGFKLKTYFYGIGYLDLSVGQTINIVFYAEQVILFKDIIIDGGDWCPEYSAEHDSFIVYTLVLKQPPYLTLLFFGGMVAAVAVGVGLILHFYDKSQKAKVQTTAAQPKAK